MHVFFCVSKNVSVSCAYTQGKREQFSGFNRTLDAINNVFRKFSAFHDETGRLNVDGMNIISNDGSNKLNRSRKDRKSGSAGMPRPISYAVFCLKKKKRKTPQHEANSRAEPVADESAKARWNGAYLDVVRGVQV